MAINPSEAAASVKANNTETQCVVFSPQIPAALTRLIGSYMDDADIEKFAAAILTLALFPAGACEEDITRRRQKIIREELLPHIFNANPKAVEEFSKRRCSTPVSVPQMLLTTASFEEGYFSDTLNKFVCFRLWRSVSAVTAPAYVGDLFYLIRILVPLLEADKGRSLLREEDSYRVQALRQLEEVEKRITEQTMRDLSMLVDAANAIVAIEFGASDSIKGAAKNRLEELKKSPEFQSLIRDQSIVEEAIAAGFRLGKDAKRQSTVLPNSKASDQKALFEKKIDAENTPIQYAEDAEFLTPLLRLLKAYINYLVQHPELIRAQNWGELNNLWEIVGECHKRLFHNVLQEYFDPGKPFTADSLVDFNCEPNRKPYLYFNGEPLNLDGLGVGNNCALYKSGWEASIVRGRWGGDPRQEGPLLTCCRENLGAITPLFKLRTTGLGNIIKVLKKPDVTAANLVETFANSGQATRKS